jgi:hypothetical protein
MDEILREKISELREIHEKLKENKEYPTYMIRDKISEIIKIYETLLSRDISKLEIAINKNRISIRVKGVDLYTWETLDNITTVIRIDTLVEKAFSEEAKLRALVRTLADLTKTISESQALHIESMSRPEYT